VLSSRSRRRADAVVPNLLPRGRVVGRDEFDADADKAALLIARNLRDACSDVCETFELWQGTRRVAWPPNSAAISPEQINARTQEIVAEREIAIRDSAWQIARSKRLLDATLHLLQMRSDWSSGT
jgi:hypothetical protein